MIEIIAVLRPKTGNNKTCSKRAADPYPAVAYSPKIPTYVSIIVFPTVKESRAAEIGADCRNKL